MAGIEFLKDVIGKNEDGVVCHPYKGLKGGKKGKYSYTLLTDNRSFRPIDEASLRKLLEDGAFNENGRIRMVPSNATSTSGAGALHPVLYNGKRLPI